MFIRFIVLFPNIYIVYRLSSYYLPDLVILKAALKILPLHSLTCCCQVHCMSFFFSFRSICSEKYPGSKKFCFAVSEYFLFHSKNMHFPFFQYTVSSSSIAFISFTTGASLRCQRKYTCTYTPCRRYIGEYCFCYDNTHPHTFLVSPRSPSYNFPARFIFPLILFSSY